VGGLTAVIEAWFDSEATSAGIVQTWAVRPKVENVSRSAAACYWLTGIMNSAYFSRVFVSRHGAESMSGKQITVKKKSLLAMPVPDIFSTAQDLTQEPNVHQLREGPFSQESRRTVAGLLAQISEMIHGSAPVDSRALALDKLAHFAAGVLYGRSEDDIEADYLWWCSRTGMTPVAGRWNELLEVFIAETGKGEVRT
jgi:hypothetical protein